MRTTLIIVATLGVAAVACKGKGGTKGNASGADHAGPAIATTLPTVAAAATMLPTGNPPELLVLVDADGAIKLAAGPKSWAWFDTADVGKAKSIDPRGARMVIHEGRMLGQPGARIIKDWDERPKEVDLEDLDDTATAGDYQDDPPPPEPEDEEDEGEEDSGGTGTAMALEEGKMGKKDSDRAEGQYKMVKLRDVDHLAPCVGAVGDPSFPERQCESMGRVVTDGKLGRDAYAVLLAAPTARVAPLLELLDDASLIGVGVDGKVRMLRVVFGREHVAGRISESADHWIEVRMWPVGLDVEAVPAAPHSVTWASGALDAAAVAKAYTDALADRQLDKTYPVDVLVSPDTDMQHLAEVLAALDQAGATGIGLGKVPDKGTTQASLRGARRTAVAVSVVDGTRLAGNLRDDTGSIKVCYDALLATRADAAGEVDVTFEVDKAGVATNTLVHGIDTTLEGCIAAAIGLVKFPASAKGTQVRARYTMSN